MSYYYMREYGPEGAVITGEGQAPGTELTTLMGGARPPFRTAMEIGAALADILTIAAEDRQVHGDIKPGTIRVDASGTVILDGFGIPRRTCRAPEGKPIGPESDVYCLGISVHSLLSDNSMGALPRDADAHDGEIVQKIMGMDFSEVADRKWVQDVQKFLTLCMAWDPAERPAALDVANVLGYVADSCPGQDLRTWAARRVLQAPAPAPAPAPAREAEEDLGGPTTSQGPVAAGLFKARVAPAAKGESTSFWSREKIQAMLAEEDEPDAQSLPAPAPLRGPPPPTPYGMPAPPPPMPPPASPYAPPRPVQSAPPPPAAPFAPPPAAKPHAPPPPAAPYAPPASPFAPPPAREPLPPARHTPMGAPPQAQASPFAVAGPVADPSAWGPQGGQSASASAAPAEKPKKKSKILWIILAVVLLLVVLPCAGVFTMGALGVFSFSSLPGMGSSKVEPTTPSSVEVASPTPDTPPGEPTTPAEPVATPEPAAVASATETPAPPKASTPTSSAPPPTDRGASTSTTTTSTKTTPTSTTSTTTAPKSSTSNKGSSTSTTTGAPFEAKITIQGGEGKIICGDGQRRSFVGTTRLSFTSVVTCRLESATGRSALQISGPSSYACTSAPSGLTCSKE